MGISVQFELVMLCHMGVPVLLGYSATSSCILNLESFMKNQPVMSPRLFTKFMRGMLNGLQLLKDECIIHNDIKPENVLVFKDALGNLHTQLVDFGLSNIVHSSDAVVDGKEEYSR
eukprot:gene18868-25424_t